MKLTLVCLVAFVATTVSATAHPNVPAWTSKFVSARLEASAFAKTHDIKDTYCFGIGSERPGGSGRYRHHYCNVTDSNYDPVGYVFIHVTGAATFKAEWLDRLR